jgi:hypothetical protein
MVAPLLLVLVVAGVFGANAVLRPGCSLLPVTVPDDASARSQTVTNEPACAALGRPLPRAAVLPDGVHEMWSSVNTGGPPNIPRMVTVAYAKNGRGVGVLTVVKGNTIPSGNAGEINNTVAGAPAIVRQVHLASVNTEDMQYLWSRDGLLLALHVQLVEGITREAADEMAGSTR